MPGPRSIGFDYFLGLSSNPTERPKTASTCWPRLQSQAKGLPLRNRIVLRAGDATFAIREADWKLVERADPPDIRTAKPKRAERIANMRANAPQQDQLFFLAKDPSEENDVRELFPERAARMRERLALDRSASQTRP